MRALTIAAIVTGCLAVSMVQTIDAIDPERALSQYIHDRWGSEHGLPSGPVSAIAQTPDGYLWIGTEKGLVRFDGVQFRLFTTAIPGTMPIGHVLGLATDAEGALWVRMQGPTVLRYHNGAFDMPASAIAPREAAITAMTTGRDGSVLLSMLINGTMRSAGGKFLPLVPVSSLPGSTVISVVEGPDHTVWVGTRDAGLFAIANGQVTAPSATRSLPDRKINCLLALDNGDVWIGTDNGVVRWRGAAEKTATVVAVIERVQALAMARDREGNVWVGTAGGLFRIDTRGTVLATAGLATAGLATAGSVTGAAVTAIFEDREGGLWVGGARGLERLRDSLFLTYSSAEGLPSDSVGPFHVDASGRTWFAPIEGGGLYRIDPGRDAARIRRIDEAGVDDDVVYSIAGGEGEIWIGRQRGGLTRVRETSGGRLIAETFTQRVTGTRSAAATASVPRDSLAQNSVYTVTRTRDGAVWAGTLSGGVSRFKDGRFTTYTVAEGLASNTVTSILEAADGALWFGTSSGVSVFANGGWRTFTAKDGLPSDSVHCLFEDADGALWIGTAGGLAFRDRGGELRAPRNLPAVLRDQVLGIADDKTGSIWIATANRLLRLPKESLRRGTVGDANVREFGLADGLRGLEGVRRDRSLVRDARGRVWVSLNRGLSVVDPARSPADAAPAIVQMQEVSGDGRQRITFAYAGLSLAVPSRVRYRYRLDGFDADWSAPVAAREAVYTNLGPGAYHFRVTASNSEGLWNGAEAGVRFEIAPLFWQTWWFRGALVFAGVLLAIGIYRVRMHQVHRQLNVRFEERLAERTHLAQELHDTLLQGFVSASMQLHVAADQVPPESPAAPRIARVLELMGQVIEEGRHAVAGLRSSSNAAQALEQAFSRVRQELAIQTSTDFRVIVEGRTRPLHPLVRDEVYRIGREAVVNAFRHARAGAIEVALEYGPHQLRVLVRDDGVGMDEQVVRSGRAGHFGLSGMRERADRIGARLTVWSRGNAGTEVELIVPGQRAFTPDPSQRRKPQWWPLRAIRRRSRVTSPTSSTSSPDGRME